MATTSTIAITATTVMEETRLGIDPPSSYLYGSCRIDDDDDDDSGDYLVNACPVITAALEHDDDDDNDDKHPWDEDCDIPLLPILKAKTAVVTLQIMGFAESRRRDHCKVSPETGGQTDKGAEDDFSDCSTVKQGNRGPADASGSKLAAVATPPGAAQSSSATTNKDESDGESDDTATTEEEEEDDEQDISNSPGIVQEQEEQQQQQQQQRLLRDHSRLGMKERTNSWFRSWWKDSHEQEPKEEDDNTEEDEDEIMMKPSAIVLDDCDHDGFTIDSALALPTFLDRNHQWQRHSSDLNLDDDDLLEYQAAQKKVNDNNNHHQHCLLQDFEDCSEIEHDDDMDMIEIIDSDDSEDAEEHDMGIDNNNTINNARAALCTTSPPPTKLLALPKSSLKKNQPHDGTRSNNNKNRRVSFHIPEKVAVVAAADAGLDPVIVNNTIVDDTMPSTLGKWKLRQWKRRQQTHVVVVPTTTSKETASTTAACCSTLEVLGEAPIVKDVSSKSKNAKSDDFFNCRNMKLLRRFRNRSAVKLLQDYH